VDFLAGRQICSSWASLSSRAGAAATGRMVVTPMIIAMVVANFFIIIFFLPFEGWIITKVKLKQRLTLNFQKPLGSMQ
jgi:hypothetical protein